jgi:hypothetical protein
MAARPVRITVIGRGACGPDLAALARRAGAEVARRQGVLITGGLGGVMEAACRGATETGGFTIGILPGADADDANAAVTVPIPTGMGEARNVINVRAGDAVVALAGGHGTLSEIALALKAGIPVVACGAWDEFDAVRSAETPEEAVAMAFSLAEGRTP